MRKTAGPSSLLRLPTPSSLVSRLIEDPDLVHSIRGLPSQAFSGLLRKIGLEDAGEIIALATTEQLVAAFDEDLFVNKEPGERESFDRQRFVVWLEVLLEAGEDVAARRVAELPEDFVTLALSSLVMVLDHDALLLRMSAGGRSARAVDKALESALAEEIDGYLLVSKVDSGWDGVFELILALDNEHRSLLERILDRCAALAKEYLEDFDELVTALKSEDSLAEDVEAEREERRGKLGHVDARDARSFLKLAQVPLELGIQSTERDPITLAYFRGLERSPSTEKRPMGEERAASPGWAELDASVVSSSGALLPAGGDDPSGELAEFIEAMQLLIDENPALYAERMEELAYLANVLLVGAKRGERRFRPFEAAEAALATVVLGARLGAGERRPSTSGAPAPISPAELLPVLRECSADRLFRKASATLFSSNLSKHHFTKIR